VLEDLTGRTAVVTGAASGIGRALAHRCVAEGAAVVAVDVEERALDPAVAEAPDGPGRISGAICDVADRAAVEALADDVFAEHGEVHLLVNNAGVFQGGLAWERSATDWDWVLGVNLFGLIHGVDAFLPRMIDAGGPGHVVNTASMAGHVCAPYSGPYQVSKFAAYGYSESLGHDLQAVGAAIGVSVLCPSLIDTGIGRSGRNRPDDLAGAGGADVEFVEEMLTEATGRGLDPAVVAGQVIDAVAAGDFLIPTNDDHRKWIEDHASDLLDRRLPRMSEYS
jgi:NAD(P)-dependent dehydrogenase (short-subunit alcohol dehydrogenase family)